MKIGILTMFNGLDRTYSLVNVVAEHLTMLLKAGVTTKLLVSQDCPDTARWGVFADDRIEWCKVTNRLNGQQIKWFDYTQGSGKVHDTFYAEAEAIACDLVEKLSDIEVCMLHDIHYQGWHLVHNVALRLAQQALPHTRFIAFTHSAPASRPQRIEEPFTARFSPMPRTLFVYPTQTGIPALSQQYNTPEGMCRVVNNSLDLLADLSRDVRLIAGQVDLMSPEILMVYPARLTPAKHFEKLAAFAGAIKSGTGHSVLVILCDFPSMDIEPAQYKESIRQTGITYGLSTSDLAFTSDLGYIQGFPRSAVLELFTLSNLFVCPSFSESFGLTVLEAASRGNFLVVNQAVPALSELGNKLRAYFMRWDARNFGFNSTETYHPSEKAYLEDHAKRIVFQLRNNPVSYAKTLTRLRYSPEWIWHNQLRPLIMSKIK